MSTPTRKIRSVSQLNQYNRCPYAYKLARIDRVWQRPASWLSMGIAVHAALEQWEQSNREIPLDKLQEIFRDSYTEHINELMAQTPNTNFWFGSGPYNPTVDIERRFKVGQTQVAALHNYLINEEGNTIYKHDGKVCVEVKIEVELGGVPILGYVDRIDESDKGLMIRDIKTGAKPGDAMQLVAYAAALKEMWGVDIKRGQFLMGKTGRPSRPVKITPIMIDDVHEQFQDFQENLDNERFDPKPGEICRMCAVKNSCPYGEE